MAPFIQDPNLPTGYMRDGNGNIMSSNGQGLQSSFEQQMYTNALNKQAIDAQQKQWGDANASMMSNPAGWGSSMANLAQSQGAASGYNAQWQPFLQALNDTGGKVDTGSLAAGMNATGAELPPPTSKGGGRGSPAVQGLQNVDPNPPPPPSDPFPVSSGAPGGAFGKDGSNTAANPPIAGLKAVVPQPKPQGGGATAQR